MPTPGSRPGDLRGEPYGFRHLGRDYRRALASLALWLVLRLTPKRDGETLYAIHQLANAMKRANG